MYLLICHIVSIEDFATDIDLTEEEQIKLLEQYENEKKTKSPTSTTESSEEIIYEKQKASKNTPRKHSQKLLKAVSSNDKIIENTNEDYFTDEKSSDRSSASITSANLNINKTDSSTSLDAKSSNSSSDGDWEKISDSPEK